ncbi:MAG TPA: ribbon-helix-helix protein, CopG family [Actinomycetota bacterium]
MAKRSTYSVGPDVPDRKVLRDSQGRVVDDEYVEAAVQDALRQARGRGRPSLSESGESPLLRVRLSGDLDAAVRKAAEKAGTSRSDWVRQVLAKAVRKTG